MPQLLPLTHCECVWKELPSLIMTSSTHSVHSFIMDLLMFIVYGKVSECEERCRLPQIHLVADNILPLLTFLLQLYHMSQGLASVAIPGGVINMIVRTARFAVGRSVGLPASVSKWLPTAAGLGSIPMIITPIDNLVDYALDNTTRNLLREEI